MKNLKEIVIWLGVGVSFIAMIIGTIYSAMYNDRRIIDPLPHDYVFNVKDLSLIIPIISLLVFLVLATNMYKKQLEPIQKELDKLNKQIKCINLKKHPLLVGVIVSFIGVLFGTIYSILFNDYRIIHPITPDYIFNVNDLSLIVPIISLTVLLIISSIYYPIKIVNQSVKKEN